MNLSLHYVWEDNSQHIWHCCHTDKHSLSIQSHQFLTSADDVMLQTSACTETSPCSLSSAFCLTLPLLLCRSPLLIPPKQILLSPGRGRQYLHNIMPHASSGVAVQCYVTYWCWRQQTMWVRIRCWNISWWTASLNQSFRSGRYVLLLSPTNVTGKLVMCLVNTASVCLSCLCFNSWKLDLESSFLVCKRSRSWSQELKVVWA